MKREFPSSKLSFPAQQRSTYPFRQWYVDTRDGDQCWDRLERGAYRQVYVATPPWATPALLRKLAAMRAEVVYAEKPWFMDAASALAAAKVLRESLTYFVFMDHLLCRSVVRWVLQQPLRALLGGPINGVTGWLLETTEPVSAAMSVGVLRDQLVHLISLTRRLLPGCGIDVRDAFAARYQDAPFPAETFAAVRLDVESQRTVPVTLCAAKCFPKQGSGKMLLIQGPDATLRLDLAHDTADLITTKEERRIFPGRDDLVEEPYTYIMRQVALGDRTLGFDFEAAVSILEILDAARDQFPMTFPEYQPSDYPPCPATPWAA